MVWYQTGLLLDEFQVSFEINVCSFISVNQLKFGIAALVNGLTIEVLSDGVLLVAKP